MGKLQHFREDFAQSLHDLGLPSTNEAVHQMRMLYPKELEYQVIELVSSLRKPQATRMLSSCIGNISLQSDHIHLANEIDQEKILVVTKIPRSRTGKGQRYHDLERGL